MASSDSQVTFAPEAKVASSQLRPSSSSRPETAPSKSVASPFMTSSSCGRLETPSTRMSCRSSRALITSCSHRSVGQHSSCASRGKVAAEADFEVQTLDLQSVDRAMLPIGVTPLFKSRMELDIWNAPSTLGLRMNHRNLLHELTVHKGHIVSQQFALMRPRKRELACKLSNLHPGGPPIAARRQIDRARALAQITENESRSDAHVSSQSEMVKQRTRMSVSSSESMTSLFLPSAVVRPVRPAGDPTTAPEVMELAEDGQLQQVFAAFREDSWQNDHTMPGLPREKLFRALEALGFKDFDKAQVQTALSQLTYAVSRLDIMEFAYVTHVLLRARREELLDQFKKLDADESGAVSIVELRRFLWGLGFTVWHDDIEEIFAEVDSDRSGWIDFDEFAAGMTLIHERQGFTRTQATELLNIFDKYDRDHSGRISAEELVGALGYFGRSINVQEAEAIITSTGSAAAKDGLHRPEFLKVMRQNLEEETAQLRTMFSELDTDCSGYLSSDELTGLFSRMGYTVSRDALLEAISLLPGALRTELTYEEVVQVLHAICRREGFSKKEVEELLAVYRMFDTTDKNELREFELARALSWLGYPLSSHRRHVLWCKVDIDMTGDINSKEFLKLMRLLREEEVEAVRQTFQRHEGDEPLTESELQSLLNRLGYAPPPIMFHLAYESWLNSEERDLHSVLGILHCIREELTKSMRASAGLPDSIASKIRNRYSARLERGEAVDPAEFERFVSDMLHVKRRPDKNSKHLSRGLSEFLWDAGRVKLEDLFKAVKSRFDAADEEAWRVEQDTVAGIGMAPTRLAKCRKAFVDANTAHSQQLSYESLLDALHEVIEINTQHQATQLQDALVQLTGAEGLTKTTFDFATFLRLVKMMDGWAVNRGLNLLDGGKRGTDGSGARRSIQNDPSKRSSVIMVGGSAARRSSVMAMDSGAAKRGSVVDGARARRSSVLESGMPRTTARRASVKLG